MKNKILIIPLLLVSIVVSFFVLTKDARMENVKNFDYSFENKAVNYHIASITFNIPNTCEDGNKKSNISNQQTFLIWESILLILMLIFNILGTFVSLDDFDYSNWQYVITLLIIDLFVYFIIFFGLLQLGIFGIVMFIVYIIVNIVIRSITDGVSSIFMLGPSFKEWAEKQIKLKNYLNNWKNKYNEKMQFNYE